MMAEMGAAYRKEEGGIYSWMNHSVGPRFAFMGAFMWFSSYVVWMVSTAAKIWVPFSTFLFGADKTQLGAGRTDLHANGRYSCRVLDAAGDLCRGKRHAQNRQNYRRRRDRGHGP